MRDDGVTKSRKLHETATGNGTYIYQNPQEKQSLHQISYQGHGCQSETYIWVYKYICLSYVKRNIKQLFAGIMAFIFLTYYTWYRKNHRNSSLLMHAIKRKNVGNLRSYKRICSSLRVLNTQRNYFLIKVKFDFCANYTLTASYVIDSGFVHG